MPAHRRTRESSGRGKRVAQRITAAADWTVIYRLVKPFLDVLVQVAPTAAPAVAIIDRIVQVAQQASTNKRAISALADRCKELQTAMETAEKENKSERLRSAFLSSQSVLEDVLKHMEKWTELGKAKSMLRQDAVTKDVADCYSRVLNCIEKFQLVIHLDIHQRQEEFALRQEEDCRESLRMLASIEEGQGLVKDIVQEFQAELHHFTTFMQNGLTNYAEDDARRQTLARNLHLVLEKAGQLLPDMDLSRGEVVIDLGTTVPAPKTGRMHVYQLGTYLSTQRVLVKTIGNEMQDVPMARARFRREAGVWLQVWNQDKGQYTVTCYGFFVTPVDSRLHLVSPYYPNGTADEWVKLHPHVNHIAIVRDAARGLSVLHGLNIFHGDLRAASIVIGPDGKGLLADFGLSKVVEESQTAILTSQPDVQSLRWWAPETIQDWDVSMASDIWSFGMTVYELITHNVPYFDRGREWSGYQRIARTVIEQGVRPKRLLDEDVVRRGLDDEVWDFLLGRCWQGKREDRAGISEVVEFFNEPKRAA
ncbi:kinase-like protein [Heliocybe sulcata]|uniref:Kinase-like protein n=1 Tax=Heliocybe sulcata TaxID=5364 RepID=A0A5C3N3I7_9AGAM|nr:kinase-like protein [Heliocybe sulcata]